jgi:transposase
MSMERLSRFVLLPELELLKTVQLGRRILGFLCRKTSHWEVCPKCARVSSAVYDHRRVRIKDEPLRNRTVFLLIEKRRFFCRHCKKPFTEPISGIGKGRRSTERFRSGICWAAENFHDLSKVQRHFNCSADTVYRATYDHLELRRRKRLYPLPSAIGIDEHSLRKPKGRATVYSTIIVDHTHGRVYDLIEGRARGEIEEALKRLPGRSNVRIVTMDLSPTYRTLTKEYFVNASIVADRFHVQRLFTKLVNRFRKRITGDKRSHPMRKLLLRNGEDLESHERRLVVQWLNFHPELREIYEYKEAIRRFYRTKGFHRARAALGRLLLRMGQSKIAEVKKLRTTLMSWREEIVNYHRFNGISNGRVEGYNRKAKLCQRSAYGYKKFGNYRLRVLNMCR